MTGETYAALFDSHDDCELPSPPTNHERTSYRRRHELVMLAWSLVASLGVLYTMTAFTLVGPPWTWLYAPAVLLMAAFLGTSWLSRFRTWRDVNPPVPPQPDTWPDIDVLLPTAGEDLRVLENTYRYVKAMRYPGTVHVYVLDDAHRPEVKALARRFRFSYVARPNPGEHKKAGNLQYAFEQYTSGEWLLVLDADFAPRPDMLTILVAYALADPNAGIVQSPQWFRNCPHMGWVECGAGMTQELFYRTIQPSRHRSGTPVCVGTCALYRRAALEASTYRGFKLIDHSEDVHTGIGIVHGSADRDGGPYMVTYVPEVLAAGMCPDTLSGFFAQQYRWCSGEMSLVTDSPLWRAMAVGFWARLSYLTGLLYYIASAVFLFLTPIPALVLAVFYPPLVTWQNFIPLVPALLYGLVGFPRWHTQKFPLRAVARVRLVCAYAHLMAIIDSLRGRLAGWTATGVRGARRTSWQYHAAMLLCLLWTTGSLLALAGWSIHEVVAGGWWVDWVPLLLLSVGGLVVSVPVNVAWLREVRQARATAPASR